MSAPPLWWMTCACRGPAALPLDLPGILRCGSCGDAYVEVPAGAEAAIREQERRAWRVRLDVVEAALGDLATRVHYSARDKTGEDSTRRVQVLAASALRALRGLS